MSNGRPTRLCQECRDYKAKVQLRSNERKRLGVEVPKGRPALDALHHTVKVTFAMPSAIRDKIIRMVTDEVRKFHVENGIPLPTAQPYGEKAALPRRHAPPPARAGTHGANTAEKLKFLDHCDRLRYDGLVNAERKLFDLHFKQWEAAGKPELWAGQRNWEKSQAKGRTASEPGPPDHEEPSGGAD